MRIAAGTHADPAAGRAGNSADVRTTTTANREGRAARTTPAARLSGRRDGLVLAIVWLLAALYTGSCLKRGWTPWDAGMLGQTAERVLHGQVPFRDFIEPFTGGLSYLNALAFRLFGVNLFSIRIPLFLFFLGWVPAVYAIARRFVAPLAAGLATLLAVAWSVPNYTEGMPSWYNLFFATWGLLALLRYIETEKGRWLWLAGLCGGLSIVVKITGLYFVAGALLFFAFREQSLTVAAPAPATPTKRAWLYRPFLVACLVLFLVVLLDAVWQLPSLATFVHFVLPGACLAVLLLWRESQQTPSGDRARFRALFSMALPFLAGAIIPVAALLVWYARAGALRDFFLITATLNIKRQVQWAALEPISPLLLAGLAPAVLVFVGACARKESARRAAARVAPVVFPALLLASWRFRTVYELVGLSASLIVPLLGLAALIWLRPSSDFAEAKNERAILVVTVAVLCALIGFPFSQPTYFCYVAPLEILGAMGLVSLRRRSPRGGLAMGALATFYLVFALWLATPGFLITNGIGMRGGVRMQALPFARAGGIRVVPEQARAYARLIPLVQAHVGGPYIYASPDCPEVYFLSGLRNPTSTLFEFLDPDFLDIPARTERILGTIRSHRVQVVVLQNKLVISGVLPAELRAALDTEFPQSARVGNFEVRWRP
jgi:hypothetical protein